MVDLLKTKFSIGTLNVGDLALRVRYRRRCDRDEASFQAAKEGQQQQHQGCRQVDYGSSATPPPDLQRGELCHDDENEDCGDGTGLLVWPGSRLLASFLVDPKGARLCFPQVLASNPLGSCEGRTRRNDCDGNDIVDGGQNVVGPSTTPGQSERHQVMLPEPNDEKDRQTNVSLGNRPRQGTSMAEGAEIKRKVSSVAEHGQDCSAASKSTDGNRAQKIGGFGAAPCTRATRRTAPSAVLELGAGTGICGMAASLSLGCPVIVTDRRDDVLANLRENVKLNGLEQRAKVVQLAWGGRERETSELAPEIRNQSPFKVILASDTMYPGKPFSDAEAFFAMVSKLLDPVEGVLLLSYTPRQPSIGTENMLRCAYQAGLRGKALLKADEDGWSMGGGPDKPLQGVPRTVSSHREVFGCQHHTETVWDPTNGREEQQAVTQRNRHITNQGRTLSDDTGATRLHPRNIADTFKGCRPVLLCFRSSPGFMGRRAAMSASSNSDDLRGSKPPSSVHTPVSESVWLSEWESIFPDLRYRKCAVRDVASGSVQALGCGWEAGGTDDDDAITEEYLWGLPSNKCRSE